MAYSIKKCVIFVFGNKFNEGWNHIQNQIISVNESLRSIFNIILRSCFTLYA